MDLYNLSPSELKEYTKKQVEKKFEVSHQIAKEIDHTNFQEKLREIDSPVVVPLTKETEQQMMQNPLEKEENRYLSMNEGSLKSNEDVNLRMKDNPLAFQVLTEGKLDLQSKDIELAQLHDSLLENIIERQGGDFSQISLGTVRSLQKNSIALEDVEVDNIPKHLDIEMDPEHKEVLIIGQKVKGGDSKGDALPEEGPDSEQVLDKEVFIEKSFEEMKRDNLGEFERVLYFESVDKQMRSLVCLLPLLVVYVFWIKYYLEHKECIESVYLVDSEQLKILKKLKSQS